MAKSAPVPRPETLRIDPPPKAVKSPDPPINKEAPDKKASDESDDKPTRQRGQRRRGRKDTSKTLDVVEAATAATSPTAGTSPVAIGKDTEVPSSVSDTIQVSAMREPKRRSIKRQGDPRYCVGRKPVTDFEVGSKHDGKVVYVKPFGIFIDIGCHSDAFCHVSRLSDDFVENPLAMFQPGDDIKNVRIVETDRQTKRITVSLQSEKRIDDEKTSLEARLDRKKKRRTSGPSRPSVGRNEKRPQRPLPSEGLAMGDSAIERSAGTFMIARQAVEEEPVNSTKELKRQQKLERRAARREQQQ